MKKQQDNLSHDCQVSFSLFQLTKIFRTVLRVDDDSNDKNFHIQTRKIMFYYSSGDKITYVESIRLRRNMIYEPNKNYFAAGSF